MSYFGVRHNNQPQAYPPCFCSGTVERTGWITSALSRLENLPRACSSLGTSSETCSSCSTSGPHSTTGGSDIMQLLLILFPVSSGPGSAGASRVWVQSLSEVSTPAWERCKRVAFKSRKKDSVNNRVALCRSNHASILSFFDLRLDFLNAENV